MSLDRHTYIQSKVDPLRVCTMTSDQDLQSSSGSFDISLLVVSIDGSKKSPFSLCRPERNRCKGVSEEGVVAVCLCLRLSAVRRSGRKGEQRLREVGGKVQESGRRLCKRGGEDGWLVVQREGQRRAVGEHVRGQRGCGGRSHLVEGEARLVAVEGVGGRRSTQT